MFLALERRISDRPINPAGGEPTATTQGAAGAARAAAVHAGSATQALLPDADGADVSGAVARYRAFANQRGAYGALEAAYGAVAIGVEPLAPTKGGDLRPVGSDSPMVATYAKGGDLRL